MIRTLIFSILLSSGILVAAQDSSTCYSVQLASYLQKNENYINSTQYPKECQRFSFGNMKAIRCGCFDTNEQAKVELNKLKKRYTRPIIVRTNRSRFKPTKKAEFNLHADKDKSSLTKTDKPKLSDDKTATGFALLKEDKFYEENEDAEYEGFEDIPTKLKIQYFFYESEVTIQGHLDLTTQAYIERPDGKHKGNALASGEIEFGLKKDDFSAVAKFYGQADSTDMQGKSQKNERSLIRIDELYGEYEFENDQIMAGKSIRFWGALEARNITDNFNLDDYRADPFDHTKLGAWNAAYTHYTETGELAIIAKFYEQDRRMAAVPYVYYYFPEYSRYDKDLVTEHSNSRPSIYLKYSGSTDTEYALDYAFIFENGYDSQRYYTVDKLMPNTFNENAYIVNKLITYNTLVVDSTLYKLEATYADVTGDDVISDYYHLGLGAEHTIPQFYGEADIGLIAEYYKYDTIENDKYDDLDLFEVYQNDLFIGARYSFNQGNDASIVGGGIFDLDYHEQVYYIEYEGRIADTFKLSLDYRYINPSTSTDTAFNLLGTHQRISAKLGYYF